MHFSYLLLFFSSLSPVDFIVLGVLFKFLVAVLDLCQKQTLQLCWPQGDNCVPLPHSLRPRLVAFEGALHVLEPQGIDVCLTQQHSTRPQVTHKCFKSLCFSRLFLWALELMEWAMLSISSPSSPSPCRTSQRASFPSLDDTSAKRENQIPKSPSSSKG